MAASPVAAWRALGVPPGILRCSVTLQCGQVFHWKPHAPNEWCGVLPGRSVVRIRETETDILYLPLYSPPPPSPLVVGSADEGQGELASIETALRGYFRLPPAATGDLAVVAVEALDRTPDLESLYRQWAASDPQLFGRIGVRLPGVRLIRQDPLECLISFICSSNNHISRISGMLDRLRTRYGPKLCEVNGVAYHAFPELEHLASATEEDFRALGFGYRAKYITGTVSRLRELGGRDYLVGLAQNPELSGESRSQCLQQFPGVGRKVADCVALFSLESLDLVPVDTHVLQIAQSHYGFRKPTPGKTLRPADHLAIGELFRKRFGRYAGWAHSVLFAAELPAFRSQLAVSVAAAEPPAVGRKRRTRTPSLPPPPPSPSPPSSSDPAPAPASVQGFGEDAIDTGDAAAEDPHGRRVSKRIRRARSAPPQ